MTKVIIDHSHTESGDEWLEIAGEVLTITNSLRGADVIVRVSTHHNAIEQIRTQLKQLHSLIPWVKCEEVN